MSTKMPLRNPPHSTSSSTRACRCRDPASINTASPLPTSLQEKGAGWSVQVIAAGRGEKVMSSSIFFSRGLFIMVMERSQWPRLRGRVGDKRTTVIFKRECRPARQSRHLDAPAERRLSDFCSSTFLFIHCFVAIDLKLPVHIETLIVQPYLSLRVMQIAHEPISRECPAQRRLLEAEECLSCSVIVLEGR